MSKSRPSIAWTPAAKRDLQRLPEKIAAAVVEFVYGSLADNPRRVGHELRLDLAGHYSARRGDFRIIYRIDNSTAQVDILTVQHRADVYLPKGSRHRR